LFHYNLFFQFMSCLFILSSFFLIISLYLIIFKRKLNQCFKLLIFCFCPFCQGNRLLRIGAFYSSLAPVETPALPVLHDDVQLDHDDGDELHGHHHLQPDQLRAHLFRLQRLRIKSNRFLLRVFFSS